MSTVLLSDHPKPLRGKEYERLLLRLTAALGVLALAGLCAHVADQWVALAGPHAFLLHQRAPSFIARLWWVGAAAYAVALLTYLLRVPAALKEAPMRLGTGLLALGYGALHAAHLAGLATGPHTSERAVYQAMWVHSSELPDLAAHVFGLCAVSVHVGLGLPVACAILFGIRRGSLRIACYGFALALWLAQFHLLSHFAIADRFLPFL